MSSKTWENNQIFWDIRATAAIHICPGCDVIKKSKTYKQLFKHKKEKEIYKFEKKKQ